MNFLQQIYLNYSNNQIQTIDPTTFQGLTNLKTIHLNSNPKY